MNHLPKTPSPDLGLRIGWQEWCLLPKLHIPAIKAKIDTGAKTSVLHAADIRPFHRRGKLYVHFMVHPLQRSLKYPIPCTALVIDQRTMMSTSGSQETRYIILSTLSLGDKSWDIEISLTNRDLLTFRMLLGRDALKTHTIIEPGKTLLQGKIKPKELIRLYTKHHREIHLS